MFKFLITGLLIYFVYRFFIAPPALDNKSDRDAHPDTDGQWTQPDGDSDEGEYIDYEEVD